jgi:hypothetical protein
LTTATFNPQEFNFRAGLLISQQTHLERGGGQTQTQPYHAALALGYNHIMASDLLSVCVNFQHDAAENKLRRTYDERARHFVSQLNNISQGNWLKGADTQQDLLAVCAAHHMLSAPLTP